VDGRIYHLRALIARNLNKDWTVERMADTVELSVPHFQKLFKTNLGVPPMVFVRDLRLAEARELLETTFHQIKQIGIQIGIASDSHFTRDFKKKFGVTPTEYRKHCWEIKQAIPPNG